MDFTPAALKEMKDKADFLMTAQGRGDSGDFA